MPNNEHSRTTSRAVIWDVDGTLIDSGPMHFAAWSATFADEAVDFTHEHFQRSFGQRNDAVLRGFLGADLSDAEVGRIAGAKEERYRELLRSEGVRPLPGVAHWIAALEKDGWRQAIASSAPVANLDAILDVLGFRAYFDAVVSGDDVPHGKPDPAIFLRAATLLGVAPSCCIVVEDAPVGVEGARRAGMRSIGVLFSHPELVADIVTPSLDQLAPDAFDRLVPGAS